MAHFAKIENGIVTQVIVVSNDECPGDFPVGEQSGIDFCKSLLGQETEWKQTSYNNNFRVRFAGIGYEYSSEHDAFIAPKPYDSWTLNETKLEYEAPVKYPEDGGIYLWDEANLEWTEILVEE